MEVTLFPAEFGPTGLSKQTLARQQRYVHPCASLMVLGALVLWTHGSSVADGLAEPQGNISCRMMFSGHAVHAVCYIV